MSRTSPRSSPSHLRSLSLSGQGGSGALGATIWILARIVYIPIYLFDVIYARTAVWALSIVGLVMMLVAVGWLVAGANRNPVQRA